MSVKLKDIPLQYANALRRLCLNGVPVFADLWQGVVVTGIPNFGNSPPIVTTIASSGYMDGSGTHATLTGSVDNFSVFADADIWWEWGYNGNYNNSTTPRNVSKLGIYTEEITGFNPTEEVSFRFVGDNPDGTRYGDGLIIAMQEDGVLAGYRIVEQAPLLYVGLIIFGVVGIMKVGIGVGTIVLGGIAIYIGSACLDGIQSSLRAMLGG